MISSDKQSTRNNRFQMHFTKNTPTTTTRNVSTPAYTYMSRPTQNNNTLNNVRLFATMSDVLYTPVDNSRSKCSSCGDR